MFDDPVRNRLANADAGYMPDLIIETFQVLKIHGRKDIDSRVEEDHHVFPSLCPFGSRHICMSELIHNTNGWCSFENRFRVHFFKRATSIVDTPAWNELQSFCLRDGFFAAVRLKIPNNDVYTAALRPLRLFPPPVVL